MGHPIGFIRHITQSECAPFLLKPNVCSPQLIPIIELVYRTRLYLLETTVLKQQKQFEPLKKNGLKFSTESMVTTASAATAVTDNTGTTTQDDSPPSTFRSPVIIVALTASSLEFERHAA
ncbi:hypothetical protein INT45_010758 [Circinella minor]|uniref:Uncharacterized protein n=1 Tax=Circinella minor TaxID=1195481 RepID=A0A8H7VIQ3_9FUNG|nr:hypothetical protein INT45_010758 [Circinella minor]